MNIFSRTIAFIVIFMITGCSPSIVLTVQRPAEVNLSEYKTIAIGDFVGERGTRTLYSINIEEALTYQLFKTGAFDIVERRKINRLLEEHNLSLSGLVDETSTVEIGKLLGSTVLIFGRISKNEYKEETSRSDEQEDFEGNKYHVYYRSGSYSLGVNIRLVDVNTGKILFTKTFEASRRARTSAKDKAAPVIDMNKLFRECVDDIGSQFARMIAPYDERVRVRFEKDRDLPELDLAISQIRVGDWHDAINTLRSATTKTGIDDNIRAKALYNYGLIIMYDGQFDEAIDAFRMAMQMVPGRKVYQDAIIMARKEKEKAEELQRQLRVDD